MDDKINEKKEIFWIVDTLWYPKRWRPATMGEKVQIATTNPTTLQSMPPEMLTTDANFITEELTLGQIEF